MEDSPRDAYDESVKVVRQANAQGIPLKLIGGQAVRVLCPTFPHRARNDQDMDFACVSRAKREVIDFFADRGFLGDARFNLLHGDRQMYFTTAAGRTSVDVVMDRLNMCHVLDFRDRINRMPDTLDVADLLLSKLQIVELNAKDVHDLLHLLSAFEVRDGDEPGTIGTDRIGGIVRDDWGWWRTITMNLDKVAQLADGDLKWKLRAKVGDRVQWYQLPEEVGH
jgi:hypothetical protein